MLKIEKNAVSPALALEMLSLEAEESSNILASAVNLLPSMVSQLTGSLGVLSETVKGFNIFDLKSLIPTSFVGAVDIPADVLKKVFVPVPEGFTGNVLQYQGALNDSLAYYETVTAPMLKEFYVAIASFVTNKDKKLSVKSDLYKFKEFEKNRTLIVKDVGSHFNKGSVGRTLFSDAYGSYAEFKQVYSNNKQLVKGMEAINLAQVSSQVKKIVDTLDIAIRSAKQGDYDRASNESLMNIATGTFEMAQQIEFLAVTVYRVKALTHSVSETEAKLQQL